jgi:hypothetical protein
LETTNDCFTRKGLFEMRLHKEFYTIVKKHIKPCVRVKVECAYEAEGDREVISFWVWTEHNILAYTILINCGEKSYKQLIVTAAEICIRQYTTIQGKHETTES